MRRKEVSKRLGSADEVQASLIAHRGRIGDRLEVRYPPLPDMEFSYQVMFDHMEAYLVDVTRRLVEAEDRHVHQLTQVRQLRSQRNVETTDVYDKQTAVRGILASVYRDQAFAVAVSGSTPPYSKALAEQVDQTAKFLRSPQVNPPTKKVDGVDFSAMAKDLETGYQRLIQVRAELAEATKIADATRQATYRAIDTFDDLFLWVARSLEGLFRLAGEQELADRVRTSAHRVTRRQAAQQQPDDVPVVGSPDDPGDAEPDSAPPAAPEASPAVDSASPTSS